MEGALIGLHSAWQQETAFLQEVNSEHATATPVGKIVPKRQFSGDREASNDRAWLWPLEARKMSLPQENPVRTPATRVLPVAIAKAGWRKTFAAFAHRNYRL